MKPKIRFEDSTIYLYGMIGLDVTDIDFSIVFEQLLKNNDEITIRINSPGGDVFMGYAIYNTIKRHSDKVVIFIDGVAASMASLICLGGRKCSIAKNGMFFIHNPSISFGSSMGGDDLRKQATILDNIKIEAIRVYKEKTKLKEEEISVMMNEETHMTAEEALGFGFVDEVIGSVFDEGEEPPVISNAMESYKFFSQKDSPMDKKIFTLLEIPTDSGTPKVMNAIQLLIDRNKELSTEIEQNKQDSINLVISNAVKNKSISLNEVSTWRKLLESNYDDTLKVLESQQGSFSLSEMIKRGSTEITIEKKGRSKWDLMDYRKHDPEALENDAELLERLTKGMK